METELLKVSITKIIKKQTTRRNDLYEGFERIMNIGFDDVVEILLLPGSRNSYFALSETQIMRCRAFIRNLVDAYFAGTLDNLFSECIMYLECGERNYRGYPILSTFKDFHQITDILYRIAYWIKDVLYSIQVLSGSVGKRTIYYSRGDSEIIRAELARVGRITTTVNAISRLIYLLKETKKSPSSTPIICRAVKVDSGDSDEVREICDAFKKISETIEFMILVDNKYFNIIISPSSRSAYIQNMKAIVDICAKHEGYIVSSKLPYPILKYMYDISFLMYRIRSYGGTESYIKLLITEFNKREMRAIADAMGIELEAVNEYIQGDYESLEQYLIY